MFRICSVGCLKHFLIILLNTLRSFFVLDDYLYNTDMTKPFFEKKNWWFHFAYPIITSYTFTTFTSFPGPTCEKSLHLEQQRQVFQCDLSVVSGNMVTIKNVVVTTNRKTAVRFGMVELKKDLIVNIP